MKPEQERVKNLVIDTVSMLCKNSLFYKQDLKIEGVIGVTTDSKDVFIVHLNERFAEDGSSLPMHPDTTQVTMETTRPQRPPSGGGRKRRSFSPGSGGHQSQIQRRRSGDVHSSPSQSGLKSEVKATLTSSASEDHQMPECSVVLSDISPCKEVAASMEQARMAQDTKIEKDPKVEVDDDDGDGADGDGVPMDDDDNNDDDKDVGGGGGEDNDGSDVDGEDNDIGGDDNDDNDDDNDNGGGENYDLGEDYTLGVDLDDDYDDCDYVNDYKDDDKDTDYVPGGSQKTKTKSPKNKTPTGKKKKAVSKVKTSTSRKEKLTTDTVSIIVQKALRDLKTDVDIVKESPPDKKEEPSASKTPMSDDQLREWIKSVGVFSDRKAKKKGEAATTPKTSRTQKKGDNPELDKQIKDLMDVKAVPIKRARLTKKLTPAMAKFQKMVGQVPPMPKIERRKDKPVKELCMCEYCGYKHRHESRVQSHIERMHKNITFKCTYCDNVYTDKYRLQDHVAIVHEKTKTKICDVCGKSGFSSTQTFLEHERTCKGRFTFRCVICNKGFLRRKNLRDHMNMHTGNKEFICPTCGKGYTCKGSLNNHVKSCGPNSSFSQPESAESAPYEPDPMQHHREEAESAPSATVQPELPAPTSLPLPIPHGLNPVPVSIPIIGPLSVTQQHSLEQAAMNFMPAQHGMEGNAYYQS